MNIDLIYVYRGYQAIHASSILPPLIDKYEYSSPTPVIVISYYKLQHQH